jgi:hypothetical protein
MKEKIPYVGKEDRGTAKAQWNHRIKPELADAMKRLQEQRNSMQNNSQSLRDLTEEALAFYLKANGIHIKAHAA